MKSRKGHRNVYPTRSVAHYSYRSGSKPTVEGRTFKFYGHAPTKGTKPTHRSVGKYKLFGGKGGSYRAAPRFRKKKG